MSSPRMPSSSSPSSRYYKESSSTPNPLDHFDGESFAAVSPENTRMNENDFAENRAHRGLRLYGKLVLDKLKEKETTNFEEVVNMIHGDLVKSGRCHAGNDKSTRRRVYDVLNVLFAMGMISKDGKTIKLINDQPEEIPHEQLQLEKMKQNTEESIKQKKSQLQDLLLQTISYKSLLLLKKNVPMQPDKDKIYLPFIVVKTDKRAQVNWKVSEDKFQHLFTFDHPFEIHDDIEVLKRMGLAFGLENRNCSIEQLEVCKSMVSNQFERPVAKIAKNTHVNGQNIFRI